MGVSIFITNHVLAGAAIGTQLPPARAAAAGFASHLAMDNLPHWGVVGYFPLKAAKRDGVIGLGVMAACTALAPKGKRLRVLAGITGACLPDTDKIGEHFVGFSPWPQRFDDFHKWIQREAPHRIPHEVLAGVGMAVLTGLLFQRD